MLIKSADDISAQLAELESRAAGTGDAAKRASEELRRRKAGLRGEAESAYLIDFDFGPSENWAVLHDLRLEHGGRVAQIDHLMINRFLDFYVLESKHFHAGLKITDEGEFLRWNDYKRNYEGMASPLEQNERHIAVLRDVVSKIELPSRLGMRMAPGFYSLVLVAPKARIDRSTRFDCSRVIKADQLRRTIDKDIDNQGAGLLLKAASRMVSSETVAAVARRVAACHKPLRETSSAIVAEPASIPEAPLRPTLKVAEPSPTPVSKLDPPSNAPMCKKCGLGEGTIQYGKYGYYFQCAACTTNTSIRFSCLPGHSPRLRKSGAEFFRDCPECGDSRLFFANA
jgi:hypothetical protein